MAKIGYARVSTRGQNDDSQVEDLTAYGCDKIFTDTASGKLAARPELDRALACLRAGDVFVITGCPARCGPSSTCSPSPTNCATAAPAWSS
jgi:DNA invertase Pin-like site-specific DNA recombinase